MCAAQRLGADLLSHQLYLRYFISCRELDQAHFLAFIASRSGHCLGVLIFSKPSRCSTFAHQIFGVPASFTSIGWNWAVWTHRYAVLVCKLAISGVLFLRRCKSVATVLLTAQPFVSYFCVVSTVASVGVMTFSRIHVHRLGLRKTKAGTFVFTIHKDRHQQRANVSHFTRWWTLNVN